MWREMNSTEWIYGSDAYLIVIYTFGTIYIHATVPSSSSK